MARFLGSLFSAVILVCLAAIVPAGAAGGSYSFTASGFNYDRGANIGQDPVPVSASSNAIGGDVGDSIGTIARAAGPPSRQSHSFVAPRTLDLPTSQTWGRLDTLDDHFSRHGSDFGASTADDYARQASEFLQTSQQRALATKIDPKTGAIRVYDDATNTFGAFNPNGTTRTFYQPDPAQHGYPTNLDYWNAQPG